MDDSFFFYFFFWKIHTSVWKDLNDSPELYNVRTMEMDTTKKLLSGHYEPRVIGVREYLFCFLQ